MRFELVLVLAVLVRPSYGEDLHRISPGATAGVCTVGQWKQEWPGCRYEDGVSEGHLSVVPTKSGNAYRVDYLIGEIGPEKGGVGWRYPISQSDSVELSYRLTFSRDFQWVKGGKLPGLCGGAESVTGGNRADGKNGFSVRLMWREDGRGEAYVYHMNQPQQFGESFPFPSDFRFRAGHSQLVQLRISMNSPGRRNGKLDVWLTSTQSNKTVHVLTRSDMEWRSTRNISIDSLLFETFYGGSNKTWAPRRASFTLFSDISIHYLD